jgi:hypothetical protein
MRLAITDHTLMRPLNETDKPKGDARRIVHFCEPLFYKDCRFFWRPISDQGRIFESQ